MKKQSLIKGTIILGFATIFARFLGLFFRIPIQGMIGDEGMGYYQMSYPLYMTFVAVASGIPIAMSKIISEYRAKNDTEAVNIVLKAAFKFMIPIGVITSILMIYFGRNIVGLLKWNDKSYYSFMVISIAPIFVCIMCTFKGYFQGLQNMNSTAVSQIIEQIGRVVLGVLCAYLLIGWGIEYAAAGAAFGTVAGGILGSIYLAIKYKRNAIPKVRTGKRDRKGITMRLLDAALPISVGAAVGTIMSLIDSILVPQRLLAAGYTVTECTVIYGQYTGKAMTIQNVPLALSMALCSSLVPIIAEVYALRNFKEIDRRVRLVFKLSMMIGIPCFLGLFYLSKPIMGLVFMGDYGGHEIMKILSISIPLIIITQTTTSILQSCGNYMRPVYNLAIGCIFKVIVSYILVADPRFNIYGAIIGSIAGYMVTAILNIVNVKTLLNVKIGIYEVFIKPLLISLIMVIAVVFTYNNVYNYTISNGISCLTAIFIGVVVYCIFALALRVITIEEIRGRFTKN